MKRREFITLLGSAAATWPLAAHAQQPAMPVIGYFSSRSADTGRYLLDFFRKGLEDTGYAIGQNVAMELRFADGREDRVPALAADLVSRQVAVLVANNRPSATAAKAATSTIPVVFGCGQDPVPLGLVGSLSRPGGNVTGMHVFVTALGPKRLHLLRELVPSAKLIAIIVNPSAATTLFQVQEIEAAAQAIGQDILVLNASNEIEISAAFATLVERKAGAVLFGATTLFQVLREQVLALAARHRIPASYEWREFVTAGGLMSYSSSRAENGHQIGVYTGRILNGAKPAELPVVQSSKFELAINLKTAKALGLEVPDKLLALADEVIE